mmetsp:Transcript_14645/g.28366  ORF Transcript_14645/g.28366 Transcript_14645/m.28366 type:complete len:205 (-) Transcript_14645:100-714(-)
MRAEFFMSVGKGSKFEVADTVYFAPLWDVDKLALAAEAGLVLASGCGHQHGAARRRRATERSLAAELRAAHGHLVVKLVLLYSCHFLLLVCVLCVNVFRETKERPRVLRQSVSYAMDYFFSLAASPALPRGGEREEEEEQEKTRLALPCLACTADRWQTETDRLQSKQNSTSKWNAALSFIRRGNRGVLVFQSAIEHYYLDSRC